MSRCLHQLSPQKHLWLLSKSKAGVLLILLSFVAFTIGERLNFSLSESKEVLFSLQIEAPEVNRMDLQEDSALSAPWKTFEGESPWMSGKIGGEFGPWDRTPWGMGHCVSGPRLYWFSGSYSPPNPPWA